MSMDVQVQHRLKGFALDVQMRSQGGTLGILGASGCGKSMTLRCIAGIDTPQSGHIAVGGRTLFDSEKRLNLRPQQRRIGYLFQNYALFPHMRVDENIACALGHLPKAERGGAINALLDQFHLAQLGGRYPGQLSGGQQQRVALARILAGQPDALLLDEPFSALDYYLKEQLQIELRERLRGYEGDVVIVTHSRDEAYHLCDRLVVMENGRCIAAGPTLQLFRRPGLLTVARLTGCKNFSAAVRLGEHQIRATDWGIDLVVDEPVDAGIDCIGARAHDFHPAAADDPGAFAVTVRERLESPFEWNILFGTGAGKIPIWWKVPKDSWSGQIPQYLRISPKSVLLLRKTSAKTERMARA